MIGAAGLAQRWLWVVPPCGRGQERRPQSLQGWKGACRASECGARSESRARSEIGKDKTGLVIADARCHAQHYFTIQSRPRDKAAMRFSGALSVRVAKGKGKEGSARSSPRLFRCLRMSQKSWQPQIIAPTKERHPSAALPLLLHECPDIFEKRCGNAPKHVAHSV